MKRIINLTLATLIASAMLVGCSSAQVEETTDNTQSQITTTENQTEETETKEEVEEPEEEPEVVADPVDVNILAIKGPTAMGMVSFMNAVENGEITDNNYNFELAASTDEVAAKLAKGEIDIACVAANLAAVLYNNTEGSVQALTINTLGILYIVENGETINSIEDLRGQTIYASGKGGTPEYSLRYILSQNGIDPDNDVTIEWKSEQAECVAAISATENAIAMLPQPFATTAMSSNENINIRLDLTEEWDKVVANSDEPSSMVTGVTIIRKEFAEENPEAVAAFLSHYETSVAFTNENIEEAATLIGNYEIVGEAVALKAIPDCNISFIVSDELKEALSGYLAVLFDENPTSIGGTLPTDDFYYGA